MKKVLIKLGDNVKKGQVLVQMSSPILDMAIADKKADVDILKSQLHVIALNENDRSFYPEKQAELAEADAKLQGLIEQRQFLNIYSNEDGNVFFWDDTLHPGQSVSKDQVIGKIASLEKMNVQFFAPEDELNDIAVGENIVFRLKSNFTEVKGKIENVHNVRATTLQYPQLASINKGDLPVTEEPQNKLVIVESYFPVDVNLEKNGQHLRFGEIGDVIIEGPWKSMAMTLLHRAQSVFWRESGI